MQTTRFQDSSRSVLRSRPVRVREALEMGQTVKDVEDEMSTVRPSD
jgi:hypothetical protein